MGKVTHFNGIDIDQTRHYVKIHCKSYIQKLHLAHTWIPSTHTHQPLPFPSDKASLNKLLQGETPNTPEETVALEQRMGIKYRHAMGEVLFPMVKCRPDISHHAILLSQYMNNPGEVHYTALKAMMHYLVLTSSEGIHYWRQHPRLDLPEAPWPNPHPDTHNNMETKATNSPNLIGFVDSDWATSSKRRNSMTGTILMYAGGAVGYKSKFQTIIAHSSKEAEFVAACNTAKMILFFRSILQDVGIEQREATILFEDNHGALMMANAQQPTRRTRHMDIKYFALLDWVEQDLLILEAIQTANNAADAMTKPLTKQMFYRHYNTYMGLKIPEYSSQSNTKDSHTSAPHEYTSTHTHTSNIRRVRSMGGYWTYV